jgi:hypothetical protein
MYDPSGLYYDPILTNLSIGMPDQQLYGLRLAPETPVNTQSGRYRVYDRSHWLVYRSRREPGAVANKIQGRKWSEDQFHTQEHSLAADVYWEEMQQLHSLGGLANPVFGGDLQIDPHADAADDVAGAILRELEVKISTIFRDTSQYPASNTTTLTGTSQWNNYAFVTPLDPYSIVSNPVADIRHAAQVIYLATLRWPNTLTIPFDAIGIIENHPRVVDRFKNFSLNQPDAWRTLMQLPPEAGPMNVIVTDSRINNASSVDDPENIVSLWGQDVWIGLVDPQPGQKTKTFAKTFAQQYTGAGGATRPTERWTEIERKTDVVRNSYKYDVKIVSPVAGFLIKTAVAQVS